MSARGSEVFSVIDLGRSESFIKSRLDMLLYHNLCSKQRQRYRKDYESCDKPGCKIIHIHLNIMSSVGGLIAIENRLG